MNLKQLMAGGGWQVFLPAGMAEQEVSSVETDSRKVRQGSVFVAIQGVKQDGTTFIQEAVSRGAMAIVADKKVENASSLPIILVPDARAAAARLAAVFYGEPSKRFKVIGITGTNGKTTSSYLLEYLLACEGQKTGVIGTVSYRFDGKEWPAVETTPGPLQLQNLLSQMVAAGCSYGVMEASSHALDQKRVSEISFCAALFTNLTQDHLDYHGTMEAYFEAKAKLFSGLEPKDIAVINGDDAWGKKLLPRTRGRTLTYGIHEKADLQACHIQYRVDSTDWDLKWENRVVKVSCPLVGVHNIYNVLGALAVLHGLGFDLSKIVGHLSKFGGVPGRLEAIQGGQNFGVFVDFAHTPDGLLNVLQALQKYRKQRLLVVFGCGGDRDRTKRPKMAAIASQLSDFVYITSDNPRSEDPKSIAAQICEGFPPDFKNYSVMLDRRKAIRQALLSAREGDIVLLAGKGHERTQVIGNQALPFSDQEEVQKVLCGR